MKKVIGNSVTKYFVKRIVKRVLLCLFLVLFIFGIPSAGKSQEILIPYRKGNLWGLADTFGKIVTTPLYDSVYNPAYIDQVYFKYIKDGKLGLITKDKEVLPPKFSNLRYTNENFVRTHIAYLDSKRRGFKNGYHYYTFNGELLTTDTLTRVNRFDYYNLTGMPKAYKFYYTHNSTNKFSLFLMDEESNKVLQWVTKNSPLLHTKRYGNNQLSVTEQKGKRSFEYELTYNPSTKLIEKNLIKESKLDENEELEEVGGFYSDINEGKVQEKIYESRDCGVIQFEFEKNRLVKNSYKSKVAINGEQEVKLKIKTKVFKDIKSRKSYLNPYTYNTSEKGYSRKVIDKSLIYENNFAIFQKKKKWGIVTSYGTITPKFESAVGIAGNLEPSLLPSFLVGVKLASGLKYGIIDATGKWLISAEYDSFKFISDSQGLFMDYNKENIFYLKNIIAEKEGKYYLLNWKFEKEYEGYFDSIVNSKHIKGDLSFSLQKGGHYGLYNGELRIPVQYKYPVGQPKSFFYKHYVIPQYSIVGKFLGYADTKGFYYFED